LVSPFPICFLVRLKAYPFMSSHETTACAQAIQIYQS
ncbi:unnamed protein product, partial [Oikopleura dioica]